MYLVVNKTGLFLFNEKLLFRHCWLSIGCRPDPIFWFWIWTFKRHFAAWAYVIFVLLWFMSPIVENFTFLSWFSTESPHVYCSPLSFATFSLSEIPIPPFYIIACNFKINVSLNFYCLVWTWGPKLAWTSKNVLKL